MKQQQAFIMPMACVSVLGLCCVSLFFLAKSPSPPTPNSGANGSTGRTNLSASPATPTPNIDANGNLCPFNASSAHSDCEKGYYCNDRGESLRLFLSNDGEHASKAVQTSVELLVSGSAGLWMGLADAERLVGRCMREAENKTCFTDGGCGGVYGQCSESRNQCVRPPAGRPSGAASNSSGQPGAAGTNSSS